GRLDVYVARMTPPKVGSWLDGQGDGRSRNLLFRNKGNWQFEEVALPSGAAGGGRSAFTALWFDADGDGWPDLYVPNEFGAGVLPGTYPDELTARLRTFVAGSQLWRNQGGLRFEPRAKECGVAAVGWAYGPALVDLDNDGWLDLYATAGFVSQNRDEPDG